MIKKTSVRIDHTSLFEFKLVKVDIDEVQGISSIFCLVPKYWE